jgi:hypothetical protein
MDREVQNEAEQMMVEAKELRYRRGERDGRAGLNPSSTSADYMKGYVQGRRTRIERSLRTR